MAKTKRDEETETPISNEFEALKSINAAPDFYGWKTKICKALEAKGEKEFANILIKEKSLLNFYLQKAIILAKLGVE